MNHMFRWPLARPFAVAIVVFLLAAGAAASLTWRLDQDRLEQWRARASDTAGDHAFTLQRNIEHAMSAAQVLAALVRQGKGTVVNFDEVAGHLLRFYPGVAELALVPGGIIRNVVPLAGNEKALGFDLLKDPAQRKEALLARDTGTLTLAGPLDLVQGGVGVVGRLPVFLDDDQGKPYFWGFTLVMMRVPEVFEAARLDDLTEQGYAWELWRVHPDSGTKQVLAASSSAALIEPVQVTMWVPNATWTLSVMPVKGWGNPLGLSLKAALGLLFSLLLAYLAKLLVESKGHQQQLEKRVAQRTAEVVEREAELKRAQSIAQVGSWKFDLARNEFRGSAELVRIYGASASAPMGYDVFLQRVHAEDRETVDRAWQSAIEGSAPYDVEYRIVVDAAIRWVHSQAELTFEADGTLRQALGTVQDITARRQAEETLRTTEEQFRGLVEQSITGIFIILNDKFAYVNPRLAEILGYDSAEELIGREALLSVAENDRGAVREKTRLWPDVGVPSASADFTAVRKDGALIEVGVHVARAPHKGKPAVIGLMQDISEKKRAEEQVQTYLAQLESAFMSTVAVATTLSELRDPYTAGHERRVGEIAVAIGAELGFDERRNEGLRVAGYLHDIGKINIPAEILSKPGRLSPIEFQLIQGHPQSSYDVLKDVEFPWPVAAVALQHHERIDGSGYPQGLKGEAILLEARIMAVADVIEAMSSHRPYRPGLGIDKALAEIERGRGSAYDTEVADACLRLFRDRGYQLPV